MSLGDSNVEELSKSTQINFKEEINPEQPELQKIMGSQESKTDNKTENVDDISHSQSSSSTAVEPVHSTSDFDCKNPSNLKQDGNSETGKSEFVAYPTSNLEDASLDGEDSATESLPTTEEILEEHHDRSDGSDSGLGSELAEERPSEACTSGLIESDNETTFLDPVQEDTMMTTNFTSFSNTNVQTTFEVPLMAKTDNIATEEKSEPSTSRISSFNKAATPSKGNLKRKLVVREDEDPPKCKKKRHITFDSVTVYYFPRAQGFTCVPSQGGSTLGMAQEHTHVRQFSVVEHALEQRHLHRQLLQRLRSERQVKRPNGVSSSEDSESDEDGTDGSDSEVDLDNYYFLQPVSTRQRRALLRAAGIRKIDSVEKDECRDIRSSREFCGCGCKGYCDPDTCSCSQAGIKCQVDRLNFPCGCSRDNCGNSSGRIEFNPVRVRTHFIHTLMRLELEKKQQEAEQSEDKCEKKEGTNWMKSERLAGYCDEPEASSAKYSGTLLKDVTLNSNMEVESCVHNGNFTNLHYGPPGEGPGQISQTPPAFTNLPAREDSLDLYSFREECYQEEVPGESAPERKPRLQPFSHPQGFNFSDPRFSDVTFSATSTTYPMPPNQYAQPYQSTFTEFSPVFNTYSGMYTPEFETKQFESNFPQQDALNQFGEASEASQSNQDSKENEYTSLNPVRTGSKIESYSDLLNSRYNYNLYDDTAPFPAISNCTDSTNVTVENVSEKCHQDSVTSNSNGEDCDENFGEIIKKSIVETVSA